MLTVIVQPGGRCRRHTRHVPGRDDELLKYSPCPATEQGIGFCDVTTTCDGIPLVFFLQLSSLHITAVCGEPLTRWRNV